MCLRKVGDKGKLGQVTLFVILSIIIVAGVATFFVFRGQIKPTTIPESFEPIYNAYLSCLESISEDGIKTLGEKGGYIESPEFVPGNSYMPFSSELDFFGQGLPYWMYVSNNNVLTEQVPTITDMERQLENYISERLMYCNFEILERQGYDVFVSEGESFVSINEDSVDIEVINPVNMYYESNSINMGRHTFSVETKLGKYYDMAKKIYDYEKSGMFLEQYTLDVLWNYAPVDGIEYKCENIVYDDSEIRKGIYEGLDANMNSIKLKGDYYDLNEENSDYFVVDAGFDSDDNINVMYDTDWTTRIEFYGDRIADPIGMIPGINMFGFCYVPYHFVYDINFPVLIQVWNDDFVFQFPVSVIIDNNNPREALSSSEDNINVEASKVCKRSISEISVYTFDSDYNSVEASLDFRCLDARCDIGGTEVDGTGYATFEGKVPECVNGIIVASASGYVDSNFIISTNEEDLADIMLYKKYSLKLNLEDIPRDAKTIINFESEDYSTSVMYPATTDVELADGEYDISVNVFTDSSVTFPEVSERTCVDVPMGGVGSLLGLTEEKCYDVNIPEMEIQQVMIGGGYISDQYFTDELLKDATELNIEVPIFDIPANIQEMQTNYELVDTSKVMVGVN